MIKQQIMKNLENQIAEITSMFPNLPVEVVNEIEEYGEAKIWIGNTGGIYINLFVEEDIYTMTEVNSFDEVIQEPDVEFESIEDLIDYLQENL